MANSEMSMESIDTGSNYSFGDKMIKANAPKAAFDLTHLSTMDVYNAGIMFPVCSPIECLMGDDFDINVTSLLRVLPQKVPLYSRQRLYVYAFYCRNSDLWANWNTFARKGNLGTTIKEIPSINTTTTATKKKNIITTENKKTIVTNSIGDYFGLPIGLDIDQWNNKINALPFFMYLKIWRDYFCNKNMFAGNKALFPDNDDDFRLDDDGQIISCKNENVNWYINTADSNDIYGITITEAPTEETQSNISMGLFFHNYPDDRFTDCLPWAQRGPEPSLNYDLNIELTGQEAPVRIKSYSQNPNYDDTAVLNFGWNSYGEIRGENEGFLGYTIQTETDKLGSGTGLFLTTDQGGTETGYGDFPTLPNSNSRNLFIKPNDVVSDISSSLVVTLNDIRELAIAQTELEKMARTDGTYMGFAMTFFGESPKNAEDYRPVYIGGTYTDIHFSEVLQTSSTTESSYLGQYAGHGIAQNGDGFIGHIHCDDYGYIMILGCIMPDVYYLQGLNKMWTRKLQSDIYLPERSKIGMIPLLKHEIYALGSSEDNFSLFGWNNPFDEYRYRANEVHGQIADSSKTSFVNYTQARIFSDSPEWNKDFVEAADVSMDYLAGGTEESAYTMQFKIDLKAIRPLPYKAIPASII